MNPPPKKRLSIKKYALKKRNLGLTIANGRAAQNTLRVLRRMFDAYLLLPLNSPMNDILWDGIRGFALRYYRLTREVIHPPLAILHLNRRIESFSEIEVSIKFRFRSCNQLRHLFTKLENA
jgi:hypothetical protein